MTKVTLDIIYLRKLTVETLNRLKFCDTRVLLRSFRLKYQIFAELFLLNETKKLFSTKNQQNGKTGNRMESVTKQSRKVTEHLTPAIVKTLTPAPAIVKRALMTSLTCIVWVSPDLMQFGFLFFSFFFFLSFFLFLFVCLFFLKQHL